jgi:hypothetical protein
MILILFGKRKLNAAMPACCFREMNDAKLRLKRRGKNDTLRGRIS